VTIEWGSRLKELFSKPQYQIRAALFFAEVIYNPAKFIIESAAPPDIPAGVVHAIPKEDLYLVRAALISHPIVVTDEELLRNRINANYTVLGLKAISPREALELARDS